MLGLLYHLLCESMLLLPSSLVYTIALKFPKYFFKY